MALIENVHALGTLLDQLLVLTTRHYNWAGGFPQPNLTNFKTELAAVPVIAFTVNNRGSATKYQIGSATQDITSTDDVDYIRQILKIFANKLRINDETYSIQQLQNTVFNTDMVYANTSTSLDVGVPETITRLGDRLFANSKLTGIEGGDNITYIGLQCFAYTPIDHFSYHWKNLTMIDTEAFIYCTNLRTVDLSNTSVDVIYSGAFMHCSNLESIILPSTLVQIGSDAFVDIAPNATIIFQGTKEQCARLSSDWPEAVDDKISIIQCDDGTYTIPGHGSGSGSGSGSGY